jgi:hypothetical protein
MDMPLNTFSPLRPYPDGSATPARPSGNLHEAADRLTRSFTAQLLKAAKFTEALGGKGDAMSSTFESVVLDEIVADMLPAMRPLRDNLYAALAREGET